MAQGMIGALVIGLCGSVIAVLLAVVLVHVSRRAGEAGITHYDLGPRRRFRRALRDTEGSGYPVYYPGRTCCPTPPNEYHLGTCKNSMKNAGGDGSPLVNDLP
jgi:hypothetical protein